MKHAITSSWMTSPVKTVSPSTKIIEARQMMNAEKIRALPVVQDEQVIGIITWRGLLRADMPIIDGVIWQRRDSIEEKCVSEIMTINPIAVVPQSPLPKSVRIMLENKIPALPVVNKKRNPLGIFTTSDVFRFIVSELPSLKQVLRVEDYMTSDIVTIAANTSLLEAQRLMGIKRIRSLPILEEGELVGLITRTDMVKVEPSRFASPKNQEQSLTVLLQPVEKIMSRKLLTITPEENLIVAAKTMLENKIHCLPVLDDEQKLCGIITDSDLFRMVVKKCL